MRDFIKKYGDFIILFNILCAAMAVLITINEQDIVGAVFATGALVWGLCIYSHNKRTDEMMETLEKGAELIEFLSKENDILRMRLLKYEQLHEERNL